MNVLLKRLIPEDDKHTIIEGKTQVEVIPDCLMTFKVLCLNRASPCKVYFRYLTKQNADLYVYVSLEEPQPSDHKSDWKELAPKLMTIV